jgi:AAA15 family ATPase/GTPase
MAELGKVDHGGGGTVAKFLAVYGMDVIDFGPPVLSMHSPFELTSVADLYATMLAYQAFLQSGQTMQGGAIMRISTLAIENYKSLKKISFSPSNFAVLIGANASGKSNFADALEFLGLVYKHGLEHAITAKGGYENIAFRRQRRSKSPISFTILSKTNERDTQMILRRLLPPQSKSFKTSPYKYLIFEHSFSFKATSRGITADFIISNEYINMIGVSKKGIKEKILSIERDGDSNLNFTPQADNDIVNSLFKNFEYYSDFQPNTTLQPQS